MWNFNRPQTWFLSWWNLGLDTPRWNPLGWDHFISHFRMGKFPGKLPYLVPMILSQVSWISCMVWSVTHISRAPLLNWWTIWCPWCVHLWWMCVDALVIHILVAFWTYYHHGSQWWWTPCRGICLWLVFNHKSSQFSPCCCMLVLVWNRFFFIFCVGKGVHLQRKYTLMFPLCGGFW